MLSYARYDGAEHALVVLNLTPVPRDGYRLGAPSAGTYSVVLNSDATAFGGSGYAVTTFAEAEPVPYHGFPQSITVSLPPLSVLVLMAGRRGEEGVGGHTARSHSAPPQPARGKKASSKKASSKKASSNKVSSKKASSKKARTNYALRVEVGETEGQGVMAVPFGGGER